MEATDLEARRQDAKHEGLRRLTREEAIELYERLDDAGLDARLTRMDPADRPPGSEQIHGIEVDPDSIREPAHLRLLADQAERRGVPIQGRFSRLRIG